MKKTTGFKKIIGVLLILFTFASSLSGCSLPDIFNHEEPKAKDVFQRGFYIENSSGNVEPIEQCAYKSNTNIFDIGDVTLTFGFGWIYSGSPYRSNENEKPSFPDGFDLYFSNSNNQSVLIKHIDDNFGSLDYAINSNHLWNDEHTCILSTERVYAHTEVLTIPAELFANSNGTIWFLVKGEDVKSTTPEYSNITSISFYYTKKGNEITLYIVAP